MKRTVTGFHEDDEEHWVAQLSCGHNQHMRHQPPLTERPWVLTPEGRASRLGAEVDCVLCDRFEMPADFAPYKRTREFNQDTVPKGLLADHATQRGVWGRIQVVSGSLRYIVHPPLSKSERLDVSNPGTVVSEVLHHLEPDGDVRFFVEFWRATQNPSPQESTS